MAWRRTAADPDAPLPAGVADWAALFRALADLGRSLQARGSTVAAASRRAAADPDAPLPAGVADWAALFRALAGLGLSLIHISEPTRPY